MDWQRGHNSKRQHYNTQTARGRPGTYTLQSDDTTPAARIYGGDTVGQTYTSKSIHHSYLNCPNRRSP